MPDRSPALSEATDAELLARHAAGDPEAFGEVVHRHQDRLWAVALRTLGQPEEAADALQDALVSAFRAGRRVDPAGGSGAAYRGDAAVTTWLHRIVINACLDRVRRARSRPTTPLPEEDALGEAARAPHDPYAESDMAILVRDALATLPVEQRAALVLVDIQGWSVDEAARILGVPTGTVKSRCARGRAKLLPLLAPAVNRAAPSAPARGNQPGRAAVPSGPAPGAASSAPPPQPAQPTRPIDPAQPAPQPAPRPAPQSQPAQPPPPPARPSAGASGRGGPRR